MSLLSELKRRNVLRMAALYVVAAWLAMQVAGVVIDLAKLPDWTGQLVLVLLAIGFPIALIISWFYELTPEGILLETEVEPGKSITHITGRRMDFIVIALLSAALLMFAYDKWWPPWPVDQSIAVLAFENMSGDPGQDYLCDGISEELLNTLAKIEELHVVSRTSAFSFKGKNVSIPEIAEQLKVAYVLEGSMRKDDDRLRVTAQLIDTRSDSHVWSETFEQDFDSVFAIQDEIAAAVSDALRVKLLLETGEAVPPTVARSADVAAYDAYLRGRELIRLRGRPNLEEAIRHLEQSIRLDANFAPAHAQLAIATWLLPGHSAPRSEDVRLRVLHQLNLAEALDPALADLHWLRALMADDPETSIEYARKTLATNPSHTDAMSIEYLNLVRLGRHADSDKVIKQQLAVDPLHVVARANNIFRLGLLGDYAEAHQIADKLIADQPGLGYWGHAITYSFEGRLTHSFGSAMRSLAHEPGGRSFMVTAVFVLVGLADEARRLPGLPEQAVQLMEGRFDNVIAATSVMPSAGLDKRQTMLLRATAYYLSGRVSEALPIFEQLLDMEPEGLVLPPSNLLDLSGPEITMRLALVRRLDGNEDGAQFIAEIARKENEARVDAGRKHQWLRRTEAMLAAFYGQWERVVPKLEAALELGFADPQFLDDPIFADLRDQPSFVAVRHKVDAKLAEERENVLQLICFENPVADYWQPLPDTCEGVTKQML